MLANLSTWRLRQKELHELLDSLDYKLKSYLKMKQNKNKVSMEFKKRQEKRIKTYPYKNANTTKESSREGRGVPACSEISNGRGNFIVKNHSYLFNQKS